MSTPTCDPSKWPFIRECQSCGHQDIYKDPATYVDKAGKEPWRDVKCKRCGQDCLDYGSNRAWTEEQKAELEAFIEWENQQPE